jgi:hypothetical protein
VANSVWFRRLSGLRLDGKMSAKVNPLMTITVVSEPAKNGTPCIRVFTRGKEASGATLGAAIDALNLTDDAWEASGEPYLVLRRFQADRFFPEEKRARLAFLMEQWRVARDSEKSFASELQAELETLVEAEQEGMIARSQALLEATRN